MIYRHVRPAGAYPIEETAPGHHVRHPMAGLRDAGRRNWHPVRAEDLIAGARKLGATTEEIEAFLDRSGFFAPAS